MGYDHPIVYQPHSDYSSNNDTLADSLWEALDTSPIIVALTDDYAHEHNLDISARFPWDDTKGIYHIKAFHHLHCLVRPSFQTPKSLLLNVYLEKPAQSLQ